MDIWNLYIHGKKHTNKIESLKNNNILKDINLTKKSGIMFWKLQRQRRIIYRKLSQTYQEKK